MNDLKLAFRQLRKSPGFTFVAVVTLALGIGANTAIFSVVDGVLLKPLPFPSPDRLVWIETNKQSSGITHGPTSMPDFEDWRAQSTAFDDMAAFDTGGTLVDDGASTDRVPSVVVTPSFFDMLGIRPIAGRTFTQEEMIFGGPQAVILGRGMWQRRFGGDPNVVGRAISVGGTSAT